MIKTSSNYRCETGGIDSLHNYKINPTVDSLNDDKLYTQNNLDFSNFSLSKSNFSKKYSNILNEFSPSLQRNTNLELNQRLNLMRIQSKMENNYNQKISSPKFTNKVQDLKYSYLTQENGNLFNSKSPLKSLSNLNTGCKFGF